LSTDTENGAVVVGVSHERFLSEWPPLAGAIAAKASALRARQAVERAALTWDAAGRPTRQLWEHGQLAVAVAETRGGTRRAGLWPRRRANSVAGRTRRPLGWRPGGTVVLEPGKVELSAQAQTFLLASVRRDRHRRRRAATVLSMLLVVLSMLLVASLA